MSSFFYVSSSITFPFLMYCWHFWYRKNIVEKIIGLSESFIGIVILVLAVYYSILEYIN